MFTKDYLIQGLALYNSLKETTSQFHLWILCVDDEAYDLLAKMNLPRVTLISLDNVKNERLAVLEKERQANEFCWTLKASFITFLLKNNLNLGSMLYVDPTCISSGMFSIYREWGQQSLFLTKLAGSQLGQEGGHFRRHHWL